MARQEREYQHPPLIRLTHWINFIALGIMVTSGFRIYNASPIWDFRIPVDFTLGGWLAGARMWHFFGMWLFLVNGLLWVLYNIVSNHGRATTLFRLSDMSGIVPMVKYYLRIRREHPAITKYNALQKLTYTLLPLLAVASILTGIAIYWPVQFSGITGFFGGYESARLWHFIFTAAFVAFFAGHIVLVAISGWSNFVSMITGWKSVSAVRKQQ
jgi:Ni/Fe-hydrogenase b-type cytochrome subunit